jgi:hypothetical protein
MAEIWIHKIIPGIAGLLLCISLGVLLGWVLEALGVVKRLGKFAGPVIKWAGLPEICATAFITALASQKAGGSMLSSAYSNKEISRRSLILGATALSVPSGLMKLRFAGPLLITTLGAAGMGYVLFVLAGCVTVLMAVLVCAQFWHEPQQYLNKTASQPTGAKKPSDKSKSGWRLAWQRWCSLLPGVLLVAVPMYTLLAFLNELGAFKYLANHLPAGVGRFVSPEAMAVIAMQLTSTTRAAPVAKEFLDAGTLTATAVFFALIMGYVINLPIRIAKRSLANTLSLYPGRNGVWILLLSHGPRMGLALVLLAGRVAFLCLTNL